MDSISFKTHDAKHYITAELDGTVVANRTEVGPWELWQIEERPDGLFTIKSHHGLYLCAELDGTVNANRAEVGPWECWRVGEELNGQVSFESHHGLFLCAEGGGGSTVVANRDGVGPWESFTPSDTDWLKPEIPFNHRPFFGPLRVKKDMFCDDSGWRRVMFCSWFPALRILRDDPDEFYRQLDEIVLAGYQGIRIFLAVGGWSSFWDMREVAPIKFQKWFFDRSSGHLRPSKLGDVIAAWPDYDDVFRTLLRACRERGLRLHVTCGDMQIICPDPAKEIDLHDRFARIAKEEGGTDVIAVVECTNEFPLNRFGGDSTASIEQIGRVLKVWKQYIPSVLTGQGAIPQNEEPEALEKASQYGEVCFTHTTRDPFEMALKRTLGLVYWEGDYRAFGKPFWQGEPAGPGQDSYQRMDDPAELTALYAMHGLTGQASNQFASPSVRSFQRLESEWGFRELPAIFAEHLPEDVAQWNHVTAGRGAVLYWVKDREFRSVLYKNWDPTPPRPIEQWTLIAGDVVTQGSGGQPPKKTGLLVGRFAA